MIDLSHLIPPPPPSYKTIIAGSRGITSLAAVEAAIFGVNWTISEVVSGGARGVDTLGEQWAVLRDIPIRRFPADWKRLGKTAGRTRNSEMARYANALIAIWDGSSHGTRHMIDEALRYGLQRVLVVRC